MLKLLKWGAIIFVLLGVGAAIGSSSESEKAVDKSSQNDRAQKALEDNLKDSDGDGVRDTYDQDDTSPNDEPAPKVREERKADGRYDLNCDYLLPDDYETEDYKFVAGGTLENTGNVGIVARARFKWKLLGQPPIVETKTVRVRRGQERDINLTIPVTSAQIDAHQSADGDCDTKVTIIDTFGSPPYED